MPTLLNKEKNTKRRLLFPPPRRNQIVKKDYYSKCSQLQKTTNTFNFIAKILMQDHDFSPYLQNFVKKLHC